MNLATHLRESTARLVDSSSTPRLDALVLLAYTLGISKSSILTHQEERNLTENEARRYIEYVERRRMNEPLAYITGGAQFYGYDLFVDSRVLIPRPETESIIDFAIGVATPGASILDVGTGSGAIAVALKKQRPDIKMFASDISEDALSVARKNARFHDAHIEFRQSNLLDAWTGTFDLIIANLPYVPDEHPCSPDVAHEPSQALYGGDDGLDLYRELVSTVPRAMHSASVLAIEHLPLQQNNIKNIVGSNLQVKPLGKNTFISAITVAQQAPLVTEDLR